MNFCYKYVKFRRISFSSFVIQNSENMLKVIGSVVLFCAIVCKISAMVKPSSGGHKYDLEIQKVLPMNDTDYVVFKGLKVKRYNRTCK